MRRVVGTQEMAELLGVKPHVLRYWEQEIPLIAPDRDTGGRKVYREQDVRLLYRVRHLVIEKKHTVQGALERILEEASPGQAPRKAAFEGLRADLLALRGRLLAKESKGRVVRIPEPKAARDAESARGAESTRDAESPREGIRDSGARALEAGSATAEDVAGTTRRPWALESLTPERLTDAPRTPPAITLRRRLEPESGYFRAAAADMVRRGELLLVTVSHLFLSSRDETPAECLPVWPESRRSLLEGAMERSRAIAHRLGRPARWLHLVWDRFLPEVERQLSSCPAIYRPELLAVPGPEARDELPGFLQPLAGSPYATFLAWLLSTENYPSLIHFTPLEEVSAPFLDEKLLAFHLAEGAGASARACDRGGGRWRLSGGMIYSSDRLQDEAIPLESPDGAADTRERQVAMAHLFSAVGGVAVPAPWRCLRPVRFDRGWPEELEKLMALLFRDWCEEAGRRPEREIDPLFAESAEELARRRKERRDRRAESS